MLAQVTHVDHEGDRGCCQTAGGGRGVESRGPPGWLRGLPRLVVRVNETPGRQLQQRLSGLRKAGLKHATKLSA